MKQFAWIFSGIFNAPLNAFFFIPFVLVFSQSHLFFYSLSWAVFSAVFAAIILLVSFIFVKKKIFINMDVSLKQQRTKLFVLYLLTTLLYFCGLYVLRAPRILYLLIFGGFFGVLLMALINSKVKVSAHMTTFTSLVTGIVLFIGGVFDMTILLLPLMSWSRVILKRHKKEEVAAGTLVGFFVAIITYFFAKAFGLI